MLRRLFAIAPCLLFALGSPAVSEAYALVPGDRIEITHSGMEAPDVLQVDLNGEIRIVDVGGISVGGLGLDEAEKAIADAVSHAGLFVDPRVSITIEDYAPVVVAGDVAAPGRFDYVPGMTIGAALAMSGGSQTTGISRYEIERAKADLDGALRTLNLAIAREALRIARYQAQIAGNDAVKPEAALIADIPSPGALDLDAMLANEDAILQNTRGRAAELLLFWKTEIETLERQVDLLGKRISVQEEITAATAQDLATARNLQERGLQTASRLSIVEQREADARSRALELESARIAALRGIADARRQRAQFLRGERETALAGLRDAAIAQTDAKLRHGKALTQLSIISGGNLGQIVAAETISLHFSLQSPRAGRPGDMALELDTPLLPGDTLFVTVEIADPEADG